MLRVDDSRSKKDENKTWMQTSSGDHMLVVTYDYDYVYSFRPKKIEIPKLQSQNLVKLCF
jgi:hypothetical protein